jgi:hypothetical protein
MNKILQLVAVGGTLALAGCASLPEEYRPQTTGALNDGQTERGLSLQLAAYEKVGQLGKPITFRVIVRNTGTCATWIPRKPQQGFFWTYPNGRHDCYFFDREQARFFSKSECVLLQPGQELELSGIVETSYFGRPGITEFRAEIAIAQNTNPELTPFWSGRAFSNSFGVQLLPFKMREHVAKLNPPATPIDSASGSRPAKL